MSGPADERRGSSEARPAGLGSSVMRLSVGSWAFLALVTAACGKDGRAATQSTTAASASPSLPDTACSHTACGSNFFVDAVPAPGCAQGASCGLALNLQATGDFHINDEYPYKFVADDAPGVEFLGTDVSGKNVFSKGAKNWEKKAEKTGVMTIAFRSADKGSKTIGGNFKLSVCSAQTCQLEQQKLQVPVAVQ